MFEFTPEQATKLAAAIANATHDERPWESAANAQMDLVRHLLRLIESPPNDAACPECSPHSDMLIDGFRCAWHEARRMFPHDCSACGVPLRAHEGERFEDAELLRCPRCVAVNRKPIQNEVKA